jgi:hypothetical protein
MKYTAFSLSLLLILSGCNYFGGDKKLCEQTFTEKLINPETAEFMEFNNISKDEASILLAGIMIKEAGVDGEDSSEDFQPAIKNLYAYEALENISGFYTMRAKAEGRLGNKITSNELCLVSEGKCECASTDD